MKEIITGVVIGIGIACVIWLWLTLKGYNIIQRAKEEGEKEKQRMIAEAEKIIKKKYMILQEREKQILYREAEYERKKNEWKIENENLKRKIIELKDQMGKAKAHVYKKSIPPDELRGRLRRMMKKWDVPLQPEPKNKPKK